MAKNKYDEKALEDLKTLRKILDRIIRSMERDNQTFFPVIAKVSIMGTALTIYESLVLARSLDK